MPSYQFNHFTGRLRESKHFQPLYPISPSPLQSAEPPKMIYDSIKTTFVATPNTRGYFGRIDGKISQKMRDTMAEFQRDLDAPVYLLKGRRDKIFFGITCGFIGVGMAMMYTFMFKHAFPTKAQ